MHKPDPAPLRELAGAILPGLAARRPAERCLHVATRQDHSGNPAHHHRHGENFQPLPLRDRFLV